VLNTITFNHDGNDLRYLYITIYYYYGVVAYKRTPVNGPRNRLVGWSRARKSFRTKNVRACTNNARRARIDILYCRFCFLLKNIIGEPLCRSIMRRAYNPRGSTLIIEPKKKGPRGGQRTRFAYHYTAVL